MSERVSIAIVGGGPAGLAAGVRAAQRGVSHVVLERGQLANTIHRYQKGKLVMAEPASLPLHRELALRFEKGSREDVLASWQQDVRTAGVCLRQGPGCALVRLEGEQEAFRLHLQDGSAVDAERLVLAIGLQGNLRAFGVPGDDLEHVGYQLDDPQEHRGERILVVGAGDAGIENALALADADNDVALANRSAEFDRAKPANRNLIQGAIRAGRIQYHPNSRVLRFEPRAAVLGTQSGEARIECDRVIGRLGAIAPRRFLEEMGVRFPSADAEAVPEVSETYESNVPGVHLIGALAGYPLIKNCMNQGFEVVEHILGEPVEPADEPILREKLAPLGGDTAQVLDRIRGDVPLLAGLTKIQLRELLVDSEIVTPAAGDEIFRRNDFSDDFYSVLDGRVKVIVPRTDADADADLDDDERHFREVELGVGDFFGEGSLLSGRRRSATVVAAAPSVLLETSRYGMIRLSKSVPAVQRVLHATAIDRRLRKLLPGIADREAWTLATGAFLEAYAPGQTVFREGDFSDGLCLVQKGAVTVVRQRAGREVVLNYIQAGNYFGEVGLLAGDMRRTATVRATVHTEIVRLPPQALLPLLDDHPEWREKFERVADDHQISNVQSRGPGSTSGLVEFLMASGAGEATDLLLIDESLCVRCDNCETACAETHGGVSRLDREAGPTFDQIHIPTACRHCENPKCMSDCPVDAIRRHPNGEVYIMDNCIGCGNCAGNCPYDVIQMAAIESEPRPGLLWRLLLGGDGGRIARKGAPREKDTSDAPPKLAVKCDLCRSLPPRRGQGPRAACVASCPTGAIVRVNPREYVDRLVGEGE